MKIKHFLFIAPLLTAFFFSCEKEIEFKGDAVKTKLVLNGILTPDSIVKIRLTESKFFLDVGYNYNSPSDEELSVNFKRINNATVELWKDGIKIENLPNIGKGYYMGTYIPKIGENLLIKASCEGFESIECSTELVVPTPIVSVDTMNFREEKGYYNINYGGSETMSIDSSSYYWTVNFDMDITFKDPKDIANYYIIVVSLKLYYSNGDILYSPFLYNSDDMVFQTRNDMNNFLEDDRGYLKSALFSDELFNGKEYKLKIKTYNYNPILIGKNPYIPKDETPELIGKEIFVELQSLSPAYYMYGQTVRASSNMDDLLEYFREPVQIYTNVKGGIGILGSYSSSIYRIPLK